MTSAKRIILQHREGMNGRIFHDYVFKNVVLIQAKDPAAIIHGCQAGIMEQICEAFNRDLFRRILLSLMQP